MRKDEFEMCMLNPMIEIVRLLSTTHRMSNAMIQCHRIFLMIWHKQSCGDSDDRISNVGNNQKGSDIHQ